MLKIIIIRGGLGNQMFIYAFYLSLKKKYPFSIFFLDMLDSWFAHGGYDILKVFQLENRKTYKFYMQIRNICDEYFTKYLFDRFLENSVHEIVSTQRNKRKTLLIYDGFWQSEKYFESVKDTVKQKFKFDLNKLNHESKFLLAEINRNNSVAIHVRRGDYLNHNEIFGNICTVDYYMKAISQLKEVEKDLHFYFFSDDKDWIKKNINLENSSMVDCNYGEDSWQDMCLMSYCKHNIIANSTFSWWGAWLNNNPNKIVIAPKKWSNTIKDVEVIPNSWIKL